MGEWPCDWSLLGNRTSTDLICTGLLVEEGENEIIILDMAGR